MPDMMIIGATVLGRYTVEDLLPEGGQACVAVGRDTTTGQKVAIRQLKADPGQSNYRQEFARFQRAAQLRVLHGLVVSTIDHGQDGDAWYTIMPFIDGVALENYVARRGGFLPVPDASMIVAHMASALMACHAQGVVHRDIKPANVIIDQDGSPHLIDFGLCSLVDEKTLTQGSRIQGSLRWMAPEQVQHPACQDPRCDLYSLGGTFYFTLTGCYPTCGNSDDEIIRSVSTWTPPPPHHVHPWIPRAVSNVCMALLDKRVDSRFQTGADFLKALVATGNLVAPAVRCLSCGQRCAGSGQFCAFCGAGRNPGELGVARCMACGTPVNSQPNCLNCGGHFGHVRHRLTFVGGAASWRTFQIPEGSYSVGRSVLAPNDQHVSRQHFQVNCTNGVVSIADLRSANATRVNGLPVNTPVQLKPGFELLVGGNRGFYSAT